MSYIYRLHRTHLLRAAECAMLHRMSINVLCLLHHPRVGAGTTPTWAHSRGHIWTEVDLSAGEQLPDDPTQFDLIILTGGPMGVYDADQFAWISLELEFIRRAIDAGSSVLGLCLGAQMIAAALGAQVVPHTHQEIGWWPVRFSPDSRTDATYLDHMPDEFVAMMWHGDTFDVPAGATLLASSEGCHRQMFHACNGRVLGMQFHPEFSMVDVERLLAHNTMPETHTTWVQSPEIIAAGTRHAQHMRNHYWMLLDRFVAARASGISTR